jgi:NCS1 family nucleobase:cation symporter-1
VTVVIALFVGADTYAAFLGLIGAVFVPMFAVLVVDYFLLGGSRQWNTAQDAPARWSMIVPWVLGFAAWWLVAAPSGVAWWDAFWSGARESVGLTPQAWMSAALGSFLVAGLLTLAVGAARRRAAR